MSGVVEPTWQDHLVRGVRQRSVPIASLLTEATLYWHDRWVCVQFPEGYEFHPRKLGEEVNLRLVRESVWVLTGTWLDVVVERA